MIRFIELADKSWWQVPSSGLSVHCVSWDGPRHIVLTVTCDDRRHIVADIPTDVGSLGRLTREDLISLAGGLASHLCRFLSSDASMLDNNWVEMATHIANLRVNSSSFELWHFGRWVLAQSASGYCQNVVWAEGVAVHRADILSYSVRPQSLRSPEFLLTVKLKSLPDVEYTVFRGPVDDCFEAWRFISTRRVGAVFPNQIQRYVEQAQAIRAINNTPGVEVSPPGRVVLLDP